MVQDTLFLHKLMKNMEVLFFIKKIYKQIIFQNFKEKILKNLPENFL